MKAKKLLAAKIFGVSPKKVKFAVDALEDVKKAITRSDMRGLIAIGKITQTRANHQSKARARKIASQKRKGRQKGQGTKKGKKFSKTTRKETWMSKIRVQRIFIKELKEKGLVSQSNYRMLYAKCKGGYFRNKRHIKLYLTEQNLFEQKK